MLQRCDSSIFKRVSEPQTSEFQIKTYQIGLTNLEIVFLQEDWGILEPEMSFRSLHLVCYHILDGKYISFRHIFRLINVIIKS